MTGSVVEDVPADRAAAALVVEDELTDGAGQLLPLPVPFLGPSARRVARRDAGASRPELVVNTTVLVADQAWFGELNELFADFFPNDPPARMTMQGRLPRGLLISIGCVAVTDPA